MRTSARQQQSPPWASVAWIFVGAAAVCLVLWMTVMPDLNRVPASRLALGRGGTSRPHAKPKPGANPSGTGSPAATQTATLAPTPEAMTEVTESVTVGSLVRTYEVFAPSHPVAAQIPALVMLHGLGVTGDEEALRDGLLWMAADGDAVVVYPNGYKVSWNGGSCCGSAQIAGIDDQDFILDVVRTLGANPEIKGIYVGGYSNGAKVAYEVACADPSLIAGVVSVHAVPGGACLDNGPVSLLMIANTTDPRVAYDATHIIPVVNGFRETTVLGEAAVWRSRDACSGASTTAAGAWLTTQTWSCSSGTRVVLATYAGGDHGWPASVPGTPSPGQVIWTFMSQR